MPNGDLLDPDRGRWHWDPNSHPDQPHWDYWQRKRQGQYGDKKRIGPDGKEIELSPAVGATAATVSTGLAIWLALKFFSPLCGPAFEVCAVAG